MKEAEKNEIYAAIKDAYGEKALKEIQRIEQITNNDEITLNEYKYDRYTNKNKG